MIIAVDGPTASGKGTIAKALATHFGLPHLDTGLLYRAVGFQCFLDGGDPDDAAQALAAASFPDALLGDPELRSESTGGLASRASIHPLVREALYERQRRFATQTGGAVLDGRDIGTVVCPNAPVKLYVTASPEVRARRRYDEILGKGATADFDAIFEDVKRRDERDMGRADSPLKPAVDAHLLDTSEMSIEAAFHAAQSIIDAVLSRNA